LKTPLCNVTEYGNRLLAFLSSKFEPSWETFELSPNFYIPGTYQVLVHTRCGRICRKYPSWWGLWPSRTSVYEEEETDRSSCAVETSLESI